MADTSVYPVTLDGDLRAIVPSGTTPAAFEDYLQLVGDAVAKIEATLGLSPEGTFATVVARLNATARSALYLQTTGDAAEQVLGDSAAHTLVLENSSHAPNAAPLVGTGITFNAGTGTITFATAGKYAVSIYAEAVNGGDGGVVSHAAVVFANSDALTNPKQGMAIEGTNSYEGVLAVVRWFEAGTTAQVKVIPTTSDPTKHAAVLAEVYVESVA